MVCITRARAHGHLSWMDSHLVINSHKEIKMVSNCLKKIFGTSWKKKKMMILCCVMVWRAKTLAHARVRDFFIKCLKLPKTYAKKIWDDFEHFKILRAHTDARTYAHARVFWPEIDRTDIDLDHDKYEWEMTYRYENMIMSVFFRKCHKMVPRWRHQSRSRLKICLCFVLMPIHMFAKFQGIWLNHFQIILLTKKWVEIRKINK